jgi:hypothetical protein
MFLEIRRVLLGDEPQEFGIYLNAMCSIGIAMNEHMHHDMMLDAKFTAYSLSIEPFTLGGKRLLHIRLEGLGGITVRDIVVGFSSCEQNPEIPEFFLNEEKTSPDEIFQKITAEVAVAA